MARIAVGGHGRIKACDAEFNLPVPSYTTDTLDFLELAYPQHKFSIIMGADNVLMIERWKGAKKIMDNHLVLVYPRPGVEVDAAILHPHITLTQAPLFEISSTFVRRLLGDGKDVAFFVPSGVAHYISTNGLYR